MACRLRSRRHFGNVKQICLFSIGLILLANVVILHRKFNGLEEENMVDPGGTIKYNKHDTHSDSVFKDMSLDSAWRLNFLENYNGFERRLRKLMEKSSESGLYGMRMEGTSQLDKPPTKDFIGCDEIVNITDRKYLASGWTKAVYSGKYKGKSIAIKTVDIKGQDVSTCVSRGFTASYCYNKAAQKIVKEILVLQALAHDNVIKVLGFCVPNVDNNVQGVAMVTELGESVNLIRLLQMSWEDRLRVSYDLTKIVHFMSNTQYGSMAMNDFRRQQFVLVDGVLKLSDVDDAGFSDPSCTDSETCTIHFSSANFTQRLPCIHGKCLGYNEKRNLFNGARHFTTYLLPHGAPPTLRGLVNKTIDGFSNLTANAGQLMALMNRILQSFKTGRYLNRTSAEDYQTRYKVHPKMDLPGKYDYRCRVSLSGSGCTVSIFDQKEAEKICDSDPDCQGFVMSKDRTWTGRILVHLKSGVGSPSANNDTNLYVKPNRNTSV